MQILLAHPGTQHAPRLARELERHGLLGQYWTGLALAEGGVTARLAAALRRFGPIRGLSNRVLRGVPASKLHRLPRHELTALFRLRRGQESLRVLHERNQRFQESIPDSSLCNSDAVIGFDTSSWALAARLQDHEIPLYLDRTIAHPAALHRIEQDLQRRYPDWRPEVRARPDYLAHAEGREHQLAHRIVVGGVFARDTLLAEGIAAKKIVVNSYGVDWAAFQPTCAPTKDRPLRFLFLGSHLARKGLPVLLDAWRALESRRGDAELWLAGPCGSRERQLIPELPGLSVRGAVPHADVPGLLTETDVLVLPSFFEGFGLVLLEALAAGVPFIATPHTGAADLPADDSLGVSVPVGSVEALRAALLHFLDYPPDRVAVLAACDLIRERFSWSAYGNRWSDLLAGS